MNINLNCRLRAYAKLTATIQGSGEGGDDFLKKIITTPADTVIDLGYRDAISGKEVYAVRRSFSHVYKLDGYTYKIKLGRNINSVISIFGSLRAFEKTIHFPLNSSYIDGSDLIVSIENSGDDEFVNCYFDVYFVFTCTEDGADIGGVEFIDRTYNLARYSENCEVVITDLVTGSHVDDGNNSLIGDRRYRVDVTPNEGYSIDSIYFNGIIIESGYEFVCNNDVYVTAFASVMLVDIKAHFYYSFPTQPTENISGILVKYGDQEVLSDSDGIATIRNVQLDPDVSSIQVNCIDTRYEDDNYSYYYTSIGTEGAEFTATASKYIATPCLLVRHAKG